MALNVGLEMLAGGELKEKYDDAMKKVLANLMDPNTPYKNKRKINIELTFEQNEERNDVAIGVNVKTTLSPVKAAETHMSIGKDLRTGEIFAEEYGSSMIGQAKFNADADGNLGIEESKSNN